MTLQWRRSNRARIMTIVPILHFLNSFFYYVLPSILSTKPQNELPSALADSDATKAATETFTFRIRTSYTQNSIAKDFARIALHRRSALCLPTHPLPHHPQLSQFFTSLFTTSEGLDTGSGVGVWRSIEIKKTMIFCIETHRDEICDD